MANNDKSLNIGDPIKLITDTLTAKVMVSQIIHKAEEDEWAPIVIEGIAYGLVMTFCEDMGLNGIEAFERMLDCAKRVADEEEDEDEDEDEDEEDDDAEDACS